ncbi:MAG: hypothetical protein IPP46_12750 [Bacteroidetes bacterium]|nr:hypothetical protein [Bacteroidota bacterium]
MNRRQKINLIKNIVKGHTSISDLKNPDDSFLIVWKYNDVLGYYCWNFSLEWTEIEYRSYLIKHPSVQHYLFTQVEKIPV